MATILIIDDEDHIRLLYRTALRANYKVVEASNGTDGLILFDHYNPELIITDLTMPFMSGFELVHSIRASGSRTKIIVASAALNSLEEREMLLNAGADLCLQKPIEIVILRKAVTCLLSNTAFTRSDSNGLRTKPGAIFNNHKDRKFF